MHRINFYNTLHSLLSQILFNVKREERRKSLQNHKEEATRNVEE
jgi:hypothetical protein